VHFVGAFKSQPRNIERSSKINISGMENMNEDFGYVRVASAVPTIQVGQCMANAETIMQQIDQAVSEGVQIVCFPELCLTGYTCADLFFQQSLQQQALQALEAISEHLRSLPIVAIVGAPLKVDNSLYNCAFVLTDGEVVAVVPKVNLPNTGEFYEKRWFTSGRKNHPDTVELWSGDVPFGNDLLLLARRYSFGIEMCEDLWAPLPCSTQLAIQGAELIFNLSASNSVVGKNDFRREMLMQQSARVHAGYIYTSIGWGESTTDLVFDGSTFIAENGEMLAEGPRFRQEGYLLISEIDVERLRIERLRNNNFTNDQQGHYRKVYVAPIDEAELPIEPAHRHFLRTPFLPTNNQTEFVSDVLNIQVSGLAHRWQQVGAQTLVLGVSGGLDSTLALLVCARAADCLGYNRKQIIAVTMPGLGTSDRTYQNALQLMQQLGVSTHEISIKKAVLQHFEDINHDPDLHDVTYENAQARERTQILMDLANKYQGLVVGTGDMSELALGWATYNGDQMSMYGVNAGVPKTLVRYIVEQESLRYEQMDAENTMAAVLHDIVDTPVSPELLPTDDEGAIQQKTEDKVGPYVLHDFFLYYFLRYGFSAAKIQYMAQQVFVDEFPAETIAHWLDTFLRRFYSQQYKRSCMPDGPKVVPVGLSPRGDWRMPSDVKRI